ncbi:hypothetical protein C0995_014999, partial [Termitomyces sp. Mi166
MPVASPSTIQATVSISALRVVASAPTPKPAPVTLTIKPAKMGASITKDPFMVTEVSADKVIGTATQETLSSDENTGDEDNED